MQRAQEVVGQLQDAIEEDRIEEGRLQALKENLQEAKDDLATQQSSFGECVVSQDKAKDSMKTAREQMAAIDARIEEATTKQKKAESRTLDRSKQRQKDLQQKNLAINAVKDAKDRFAHEDRKRDELVYIVADHTTQATEISARVPVPEGETATSLDKKLEKLQKDLDRGVAR